MIARDSGLGAVATIAGSEFSRMTAVEDGEPYANMYAWLLTMRDEKVTRAVAFFDSIEFNEFWTRVPPVAP